MIVNVHVEAANINDVTPMPEILDEIEARLGTLPKYMGLDAGYHNAWIAHLLETKGIQGVIGYRRHTHKGAHYGKYRFRYDPDRDEYICPEKQRLTWKTTTREGYRQYCCEGKTCKGCPRRAECFGASMNRRVVERHVWQEALERSTPLRKTHRGKRIYGWRKETIERSFAEAKENHGLRYGAHAWNTEHAGAVFLDSGGAKYQEAGGLFLSRFSSLSNTLPPALVLNAGVCQWSERPAPFGRAVCAASHPRANSGNGSRLRRRMPFKWAMTFRSW